MKDCCRETYKKTLEEVLNFIINPGQKGKSFAVLISTLQYAIEMLKKNKEDEIKIIFDESDKIENLLKFSRWRCMVCDREREDQFISVRNHEFGIERGLREADELVLNVKYCNDQPLCTGIALVKDNWIKMEWPLLKEKVDK